MVTRTPLCSVKDCPAPRDPDWHVPHCGHGLAGSHQHFPKKSQGGKEIVAFLCTDCHMETDNGLWHDGIIEIDGVRRYYIKDIQGNDVLDIVIGVGNEAIGLGLLAGSNSGVSVHSGGDTDWTGDSVGALTGGVSGSPLSAEASNLIAPDTVPSRETAVGGDYETAVETSPNRVTTVTGPGGVAGTPRPFDVLQPLPPDLSLEEWIAWGEMLGKYSNVTMWRIGEWLAYGEERSWGEKYSAGMHATGKSYSTLSGYVWIVKTFKDLPIAANLSMGVLQAIAPEVRRDAESGEKLVIQAAQENWTSTDARDAVRSLSGIVEEREYHTCECGNRHLVK